MIKIVTLTGADDSIQPEQLLQLSDSYPFAEWAILVGREYTGKNRFPLLSWIYDLVQANKARVHEGKPSLNLSMHLCGQYVCEILHGAGGFIYDELFPIWGAFQRVQINTHGVPHNVNADMVSLLNEFPEKEFIFQYDNCNGRALELAFEGGVKCSALFDLSHGAGVLPEKWPDLLPGIKCGYAGGLSPDNILGQMQSIEGIVGDNQIWIDMETHLRSHNDRVFDLVKVEKVLKTTADFVGQHSLKL